MPQKYKDMVGREQQFSGHLFSSTKKLDPITLKVLDLRFGSAQIMDMKKMEIKHPSVEFLVKGPGMKRSRWTKPFAVREIILNESI